MGNGLKRAFAAAAATRKRDERFTPGDWRVVKTKRDGNKHSVVMVDGVGVIATTEGCAFAGDRARANARLMAQSPEMYALLAELDDLPKDIQGSIKDCIDWVNFRGRVNAVLQKARGELNG